MTARSPNAGTPRNQAALRPNYPDALYKQLVFFRLPPALERTNDLLGTTPVDLRKLGRAIQDEPDVAAETVRLCNSSLFSLPRPVSSLEQAVVTTDAEIVRTLLVTCWLTRRSSSKVVPHENQLFWSHSLLAARISRRIGEWTGLVQSELVFLAGLLHDIGDLPFLTLFSSDGIQEHPGTLEDLGESVEIQRRHFGTDHCELGGRLGALLRIHPSLAEVVLKHQQSGPFKHLSPLVAIVGAAEAILQAHRFCTSEELPTEGMGASIQEALAKWLPGLNPSAEHHLITALEQDLLSSSRSFAARAGNVLCGPQPGSMARLPTERSSSSGC